MNKEQNRRNTADCISRDPEMKGCFESLPQMVKESILMSGVEITSAGQLRALADNLLAEGR